MIEIFHVSDLHFGNSDEQNDNASSLLAGINRLFPFKDHEDRYLLITGDITQSGDEDQFALAGHALSPFVGRVFVTPGNHDYGSLFGTAYSEEKARYFDNWAADALQFTHHFFDKRVFVKQITNRSNQAITIMGLNSCAKEGIFDLAQGEVGEEQRRELAQKLDQCGTQTPRIIFLHHIPNKEADWSFAMTLRDWEELMVAVRGKVDLLAFGHQGNVLEIGLKAKARVEKTQVRRMKVRSIGADNIQGFRDIGRRTLVLDANNSVDEQKFYRITLEGNKPKAEVLSLAT